MIRGLLTATEVGKELGVTSRQVCLWVRSGKIRADRVGRSYLIGREEADRFAAGYSGPHPNRTGRPKLKPLGGS